MHTPGTVTDLPDERVRPEVSSRPDYGLSRARRIVRSADYQRVFSQRHRKAGRFLVLWVAEGATVEPRVGVIASKRTFRRAVDRARAKRLLREAFRLNRDGLARYTDCVVIARRAILGADRHDVERDLLSLARRCRIMRKDAGDER